MKFPLILVNFKLYESAVGEKAVALAQLCERVADESGVSIAVAVNHLDVLRVAESVKIPVFAQHVDAVSYGSKTGHVSAPLLKSGGVFGVLLNHAERPLNDEVLMDSVYCARKAGLFTVVCANTPERGEKVAEFDPDLVAVEPPDLIGGDVSVCDTDPSIINDAVEKIGENKVLIGAGVHDAEDVRVALERKAVGVLLASAITKAQDPEAVLRDLVSGCK